MKTRLIFCAFALALAADAQTPDHYLDKPNVPDLKLVLENAPATGSARDASDRAIFKSTRALKGTARWKLAAEDDNLSVAGLMSAFRCSLGEAVTPENAPKLAILIRRVSIDATGLTGVKYIYRRKRPFHVDEGPLCVAMTPSLETSFDYPSGHTLLGWAVGLIFAELEPEHATDILMRARAFGESRVVCGVHNASAVEAGRTAGATLFVALEANAEFRADLENARKELAALQSESVDAAKCSVERSLILKSPY